MRIQDDFLDIPHLALTIDEASRRFEADTLTCGAVLAALASAEVLTRNGDGAYIRYFPRHLRLVPRGNRPAPAHGGRNHDGSRHAA